MQVSCKGFKFKFEMKPAKKRPVAIVGVTKSLEFWKYQPDSKALPGGLPNIQVQPNGK